jgi:hypothetical protein
MEFASSRRGSHARAGSTPATRSLISSPASRTSASGRANRGRRGRSARASRLRQRGPHGGPVDAAAADACLEQDRRSAGARGLHAQAASADVHEPDRPVTSALVIFGVLRRVHHRHGPPRESRRARQRQTSRPPPNFSVARSGSRRAAPGLRSQVAQRHASRRRARPGRRDGQPATSGPTRGRAATAPRVSRPRWSGGRRQEPLTSRRAPCRMA